MAAVLRVSVLIAAGTLLLALSAKVNGPLPHVPMTMQSLVVLLIAVACGWRLGVLTVLAYLAEAVLGWPVLTGPLDGIAAMAGPTAGYLLGFLVAVFLAGWIWEAGWVRSAGPLAMVMGIGHGVVLAGGFAWLATGMNLGGDTAWLAGVVPFIAGSVVKSSLGAMLLTMAHRGAGPIG